MQAQQPPVGFKIVKTKFRGIYQIPIDWEIKRFADVIKMEYGFGLKEEERAGNSYPVYGSGGIVGRHEKYAVKGPGLIVARKGSLGNVFYSRDNFWPIDTVFCITQELTQLDLKYLYFLLQHIHLEDYAIVTAQPGISREEINTILVKVPPIAQQQRIASILTKVDDLIQKTDEIIEQTRRLKKGLMQRLFLAGIKHEKYKAAVFEFGRQVEIPDNWNIVKLGSIVKILDSKRVPLEASEREKMKGPFPYYGASGVIDYVNDYIFDDRLLCLAEDGENLRSRVLPVAFTIEGKTWVNNHAHVLSPRPEVVDHEYLQNFLNFRRYENYLTFTAQPKLTQREMEKILIMLPPIDEQRKIASVLSSVDNKIKSEQAHKQWLNKIKKGLMQKLLTGQIRVKV